VFALHHFGFEKKLFHLVFGQLGILRHGQIRKEQAESEKKK
jgi:hypothetical protein